MKSEVGKARSVYQVRKGHLKTHRQISKLGLYTIFAIVSYCCIVGSKVESKQLKLI